MRSIPPPIIFILRLLSLRLLILLHFSPMARMLRLLGIIEVASIGGPGIWRLVSNWPVQRIDWGLSWWRITDHTTFGVVITTFKVVVFMFIQFHVFTILPNIFGEMIC
jgi:hypothetical protein